MHLKTENFEGTDRNAFGFDRKEKNADKRGVFGGDFHQFLDYFKTFEKLPYADTASFIETASILMLIKSRSLLPQMEISEEERQSIEELEKRLEIYKFIRDVSGMIKIFTAKPRRLRENRLPIWISFLASSRLIYLCKIFLKR